ncbi:hypothetical protein CEP48_02200 [Mergibacter septicus]|uniref:Uncharacterized protein n=1 Tax=Mergibacter septicus TaxID=221402 RepID=A0A8E3S8B1_9PAST|nr:AraC family transcriptional regulator [Mergibacter septicus]AWX15045.1 hypothetical protein CEP47_02200 [Mergibacter septicus]QDJ14297.1 hypothetical protein CEP48_02200 [Mergibacter septicus]UTU48262.1 helix-turn-helix transcriptional regulator [Mergibacter septicus]WMR96120.1 AraC family transcriptional regulator [Mergibacter septicus]
MNKFLDSVWHIRSNKTYQVKNFFVQDYLLGIIYSGEKRLFTPTEKVIIGEKQIFILNKYHYWDMINKIADKSLYQADIIQLSSHSINTFQQKYLYTSPKKFAKYQLISADPTTYTCFSHIFTYLKQDNNNPKIKQHKIEELLLHLAENGIIFPTNQTASWYEKVKNIIQSHPTKNWILSDLAEYFYLSESSLKRRLSQENTSFREILKETRLNIALTLILTSSKSLTDISTYCGYSSLSNFTQAFKLYFSCLPSELR